MKIAKITILALILLCAVGMVAAADIASMKVANGYENIGNGSYSNVAENIEIDVYDGDIDDFFDSDDDTRYTVVPGAINNTFNFTDEINNITGIVELVQADGKYFAVTFWTYNDGNSVDLEKYSTAMEEFNKLNNFTALDSKVLDD